MLIRNWHVVVFWLIVIGALLYAAFRKDRVPHLLLPADGSTISGVQNPVCRSYPFAIVPCGLHSMDDLEVARDSDRMIREHYADIGIVRPAILRSDEMAFVSYRQPGGRIVWTFSRVLIKTGELILEDRAGNRVRARCGNLISSVPRNPRTFVMPPELDHETPVITFPDQPLIAGKIPPADYLFPLPPSRPHDLFPPVIPVSSRTPYVPPYIFFPGGNAPIYVPPAVLVTPEPRTGILMAIPFALVILFSFAVGFRCR